MKYRTLGNAGLRVSVVGIGTWQFGGEWGKDFDQAEVDAMFARGRGLGINLIDTAECYGDHTSEAFIGRALQNSSADRDQWVLCSKFGHKFHKPFDRSEPRDPADVVEQTEASLRALQTDYLDVQQYHSWGDDKFFDDDVLAAVHKLKDQGKVRHVANSVGSNGNVKQVAASADRGIEAIQIIYNRLDRTPEQEVFEVCREQNLGVLARVPLASGYLSGKYKPGHAFGEDEVRGKWHSRERTDKALAQVQQIKADEYARQVDPQQVSMATWALAWVLQNPAVTCVIPGCKTVAQVESNAAAADLDMVPDDHPQAAPAV
jgi:aryl-alcohol dehydrogenase-like predicted oxidoreductase